LKSFSISLSDGETSLKFYTLLTAATPVMVLSDGTFLGCCFQTLERFRRI
jgi:hypothetical protein